MMTTHQRMNNPSLAKGSPAPTGGKKGKKKKAQVMSLDQFLAVDDGYSAPKAQSWAVQTEDDEEFRFDRSALPTAPKAAIGPSSVDLAKIPVNGPFSAYVGNLSYEAKEDDLEAFFSKLEIDNIRMITDGGRPRGYAYVDFLTRESLIEALTYHDKDYMGRNIRVDLASQKDQDRGGFGSRNRSDEPDRTEGDWRRRDPADSGSSFGSRDNDRGGRYGDRDGGRSYGDRDGGRDGGRDGRGYGFGSRDNDRDRGGDPGSGTWERGGASERPSYGGDRGGRDRGGFGGDRTGGDPGTGTWERGGASERSFGGDRDRGYGGDRDRGFGGDRGGDRGGQWERGGASERSYGGDRDRGFGGDRDGGRYGGSRDDRYGGGRRDDYGRGGGRDDFRRDDRPSNEAEQRDVPAERPKLKLQPRSKPEETSETKQDAPAPRSSIFGSAKPVDTTARERQIEEKVSKPAPAETKPASRPSVFGSAKPVDTYAREKEIEEKLKHQEDDTSQRPKRQESESSVGLSRQDSHSSQHSEHGEEPRSPTALKTCQEESPKLVPAPPPKENAWGKKREIGDSSNNATTAPTPAQPSTQTKSPPERKEAPSRDRPAPAADRRGPAASKGSAWDRGTPGRGDGPRNAGDRSNGYGRRRDDHPPQKPKQVKERHIPQHYDEMPKYEENRAADFTNSNKFAILPDEDSEPEEETAQAAES